MTAHLVPGSTTLTDVTHPASCKHPETCDLSYRDHLVDIQISPAATPSRAVTRTEGLADEPTSQTRAREARWDKDLPAFKRMRQAGLSTRLHGAARIERELGG